MDCRITDRANRIQSRSTHSITAYYSNADGNFSVPVALPAGATYEVVVTPGTGYAPGATAPQVATG